ncbi:hypothetical protein FKP32DRAFT_1593474 [Trametes sanguinea]|nr:hypothetical protein FKP32DRAFT_1593474 [Trametes sanguinea]
MGVRSLTQGHRVYPRKLRGEQTPVEKSLPSDQRPPGHTGSSAHWSVVFAVAPR